MQCAAGTRRAPDLVEAERIVPFQQEFLVAACRIARVEAVERSVATVAGHPLFDREAPVGLPCTDQRDSRHPSNRAASPTSKGRGRVFTAWMDFIDAAEGHSGARVGQLP
ncbi:MAG: hypothetical protein AB7Q97_02335 [Gammaproteobacteria bacterium]